TRGFGGSGHSSSVPRTRPAARAAFPRELPPAHGFAVSVTRGCKAYTARATEGDGSSRSRGRTGRADDRGELLPHGVVERRGAAPGRLRLRGREDLEAGAPQQRAGARPVAGPPVRGCPGEAVLVNGLIRS